MKLVNGILHFACRNILTLADQSIILGRAEAFACKNGPVASLCDGIGIGLGFTLGLTLLGTVREFFGAGSIFGFTLLPETYNVLLFILPPGAFISLGYLIAIINKLKKA